MNTSAASCQFFLDTGSATGAGNLMLGDEHVEAIPVNISAAINCCGWIVESVLQLMHKFNVGMPVIG